MSKTDPRKKASVALLLAGAVPVRRVAAEAGVGESTVRAWRRQPEFAAAVEELAALVRAGGRTGPEMFEAASEVLDRLAGEGRAPGPVTVTIPAGASARKRRQLLARGIARVLADQL